MSLIFGFYYCFILRNNGTAMAVLAAPLPAALLVDSFVLDLFDSAKLCLTGSAMITPHSNQSPVSSFIGSPYIALNQ